MEAVFGVIPVGVGASALGILLWGQLCAPAKAQRREPRHGSALACLRANAALHAS